MPGRSLCRRVSNTKVAGQNSDLLHTRRTVKHFDFLSQLFPLISSDNPFTSPIPAAHDFAAFISFVHLDFQILRNRYGLIYPLEYDLIMEGEGWKLALYVSSSD